MDNEFRVCTLPPSVKNACDQRQLRASYFSDPSQSVYAPTAIWKPGQTIKWWAENHVDVDILKDAFAEWEMHADLNFQRVNNIDTAVVRVGFNYRLGSWSYIGTDVLSIPSPHHTMNFGWSLSTEDGYATALHEIAHTLGLEHEHQHPRRSIAFNAPEVYRCFPGDRETLDFNIIQVNRNSRYGSYDPDSITHYGFPAKTINAPEPYASEGIGGALKLSKGDIEWANAVYPKQEGCEPVTPLRVMEPYVLALGKETSFALTLEDRVYTVAVIGSDEAKIYGGRNSSLVEESSCMVSTVVVGENKKVTVIKVSTNKPGLFMVWERLNNA